MHNFYVVLEYSEDELAPQFFDYQLDAWHYMLNRAKAYSVLGFDINKLSHYRGQLPIIKPQQEITLSTENASWHLISPKNIPT